MRVNRESFLIRVNEEISGETIFSSRMDRLRETQNMALVMSYSSVMSKYSGVVPYSSLTKEKPTEGIRASLDWNEVRDNGIKSKTSVSSSKFRNNDRQGFRLSLRTRYRIGSLMQQVDSGMIENHGHVEENVSSQGEARVDELMNERSEQLMPQQSIVEVLENLGKRDADPIGTHNDS
ncbi:hypothetical protein Ancab_001802 [Ancistrocladus abbreviatus]